MDDRPRCFDLLASFALFAAGILGQTQQAAASCGPDPDACQSGDGSYHLALPPDQGAEPALNPAVIFLHGYGGSGAGSLKNTSLVEGLTARGYAVIAPDALPRGNGRRSWTFFPGWAGRDEAAFLKQVADDAAARFDLDRGNMVLAGFSAGAFMVNYLACADPQAFAAYAPVSGGFWRPQPLSCAGPVRLFHSHGWSDGVVPLEGRFLGGGQFQQGDIFAGLELWRQTNGCQEQAPDKRSVEGGLLRRDWDCQAGADIDFVLFPGGHQIPKGWSDWMLDWLERPQDGRLKIQSRRRGLPRLCLSSQMKDKALGPAAPLRGAADAPEAEGAANPRLLHLAGPIQPGG